LDANAVIVVPGPLTMTGDRYEWLCPPADALDPSPVRTVALAVMLAASAELISRAARFGEAEHDAE
jgi:hypothetical protein